MSNNSSTGGYIVPSSSPAPLEDQALEDAITALIVGVTGLPGQVVFPQWQPTPPTQPLVTVDWVGVGLTDFDDTAGWPALSHNSTNNGTDTFQTWEDFKVLASFYGPNCSSFCRLLRDGIRVPQNLEAITLAGMGLRSVGKMVRVPEFVNGQWLNRYDLDFYMTRNVIRVYPIENLATAPITVKTDTGITVNVVAG